MIDDFDLATVGQDKQAAVRGESGQNIRRLRLMLVAAPETRHTDTQRHMQGGLGCATSAAAAFMHNHVYM